LHRQNILELDHSKKKLIISDETLLVFIGGPMIAAAETKGERPDVTNAIHLGLGAEKNVAFSLNFKCRPGDQPVIVGLGEKNQYIPLQSKECP
jgi:hypothetical protein